MIIQNRKKKVYSEKLFKELCFLYELIEGENRAYIYCLNKKLKKSKRTYYRYAKDLFDSGVIPQIGIKKDTLYKFFYIKEYSYENIDYYDFVKYLLEYCNKKINKINNKHAIKLKRLAILLMVNINTFHEVIDDEEYTNPSTINGSTFAFFGFDNCVYLYKDLNQKTMKRDILIVKKVLINCLNK